MRLEDMNPLQRAEHTVEFYETTLTAFAERGLDAGQYPELLEQAKTRLNNLLVSDANMTSIMHTLNMDPAMLRIEADYNRIERERGL